tara:strand:- start:512 stop:1423 length:912 start_codon:yes stop_codon:yes gene_type:complete
MSTQITTSFIQGFKQGIDILTQQKGSKLQNTVRNEMQASKQDHYDQIGSTTVVQRTSRHGDTPIVNTPHSRRNVTLNDYEWADLIDRQDRLRVLNDPGNAYSTNAAFAMGRKKDELILAAVTGTSTTGETGTGSTSLSDVTTVNANDQHAALSISNLLEARTILNLEDDSDEEATVVCSAYQIAQLLNDEKISSADYNTVRALASGQIDTFMGFRFVQVASSILPMHSGTAGAVTSGDIRIVPVYKKSGLLLSTGVGESGSSARITERADKSYSTQIYYSASFGSTRMEEAKVTLIYVGDDAP